MPKVHHRQARKDYPAQGISKGDMYYTWSIKMQRGGIVRKSLTYPKRSQLTMSDYLGQAYDLDDAVQEASDADELRSLAADIEALRDEQQEKLENMPEQLQYAPSGELLQERIDACEEWAQAVETAADELDQFEPDEDSEDDEETQRQAALDDAKCNIESPV